MSNLQLDISIVSSRSLAQGGKHEPSIFFSGLPSLSTFFSTVVT
jgi:hypothetical protein